MVNTWTCSVCGAHCDSGHDHDIIDCRAQQNRNAGLSDKPVCGTCEGHGRINCAADEDGFTHPCEDCQPHAHKHWQDGYMAAMHYAGSDLELGKRIRNLAEGFIVNAEGRSHGKNHDKAVAREAIGNLEVIAKSGVHRFWEDDGSTVADSWPLSFALGAIVSLAAKHSIGLRTLIDGQLGQVCMYLQSQNRATPADWPQEFAYEPRTDKQIEDDQQDIIDHLNEVSKAQADGDHDRVIKLIRKRAGVVDHD